LPAQSCCSGLLLTWPASCTFLATLACLFISKLPNLLLSPLHVNCTSISVAQVLHRLNHCRCRCRCSNNKALAQVRWFLSFQAAWLRASPSQPPLFPSFISNSLVIPLSHFLHPISYTPVLTSGLSYKPHLTTHTVRPSTYKMHSSTILTLASALALASAAGPTGALGDAAVVQKNPAGVTYTATLPNSPSSGVRGYVSGTSNANGTGVLFNVNLSGFPDASLGPFCTFSPFPPRPTVNRPLSLEGTKKRQTLTKNATNTISQCTTSTISPCPPTATAPALSPT